MIRIKASFTLPYYLRLAIGPYQAKGGTDYLALEEYALPNSSIGERRTVVSAAFDHPDNLDSIAQENAKAKDSEVLLLRANHLLRWYRSITQQAEIIEVTGIQASPFKFVVEDTQIAWGNDFNSYESGLLGSIPTQNLQNITQSVRDGLAAEIDPKVSALFLLDAEQALRQGRFRETVLLCWSTIEATFDPKYKALVKKTLKDKDLSREEREFFEEARNTSLRYRMSVGLSFFSGGTAAWLDEKDDFWKSLAKSYKKRNKIIHDGENAEEVDAKLALRIAKKVVELIELL